jgi:hypothetical protein
MYRLPHKLGGSISHEKHDRCRGYQNVFKLIISRHGCPEGLISDSGSQFIGNVVKDLCDSFHIKKVESSTYHQQANGKIEKFIKFFKLTLATVLYNKYNTVIISLTAWDEAIDHCCFVYRISWCRSNNDTPFFLIYGRDAILPQDLAFNLEVKPRGVEDNNGKNYQWKMVKERLKIMDKLIHQKENYQSKYKNYYDKNHKEIDFKIGDKCWVLLFWLGPFEFHLR